jgi:hypothetical protein
MKASEHPLTGKCLTGEEDYSSFRDGTLLPMLEWLFGWEVTSVLVAILIGIAFAVLALSDFKIARVFFILAAFDAFGGVAMWGAKSNLGLFSKGLIIFVGGGIICVLLSLALNYVGIKESVSKTSPPGASLPPASSRPPSLLTNPSNAQSSSTLSAESNKKTPSKKIQPKPEPVSSPPSAQDALHLAFWRIENDPDHLTLYDLFLTDFKVLAVGRTQPLQRTGGASGSVMVERRVAYDLATNTKFVMMYVPSVEDTYGICNYLSTTVKSFLEEAGNLRAIGKAGIKPPGDSDKESVADAVFSGRVFIYTEWTLTAEQIGELTKSYSSQNLKLQIRGSEHVDYQILQYRLKRRK